MYDLHCHAGFSADPAALGMLIEASDLQVLSATVTPDEFTRISAQLADAPSVHIAAGLHPWWIPDDELAADKATEQLLAALERTRFVGEIGLDFSPSHVHSKQAQLHSCARILAACADKGGKVLTIHSVRATNALLDLLEETRCTANCACIMHWFSGTSDELHRAIELGCFFSVGEHMLATKRGRAYVRAIPEGRLLLETDLPEKHDTDIPHDRDAADEAQREFDELTTSLETALAGVLALGSHHTESSIETASRELLDRKA